MDTLLLREQQSNVRQKSYESSYIDQAVTAVPLLGAIPLPPAMETT